MSLICDSCGQTENFGESISANATVSIQNIVDGDGNYFEQETIEIEDVYGHEHQGYTCSECNSDSVSGFDTTEELNLFIYEHTDEEGDWHADKLPEEKRNAELRKKLILNKI